METSLHRQLKSIYAGGTDQTEVALEEFRIDAIRDGTLVEIQHGSLAAIRDKIRALVERKHRVLVVKPIVLTKTIIKQDARGGQIVSRRLSPKRGTPLDLFHELVYFTRAFPHPRLVLETPLVAIEEWRYPGHGKRRRWRKEDHVVEDQRLARLHETHRYATEDDLWRLLPVALPSPFHTGHLAEQLSSARWIAQRIAYCLLKCGATREVGKSGNSRLYERVRPRRPASKKERVPHRRA